MGPLYRRGLEKATRQFVDGLAERAGAIPDRDRVVER